MEPQYLLLASAAALFLCGWAIMRGLLREEDLFVCMALALPASFLSISLLIAILDTFLPPLTYFPVVAIATGLGAATGAFAIVRPVFGGGVLVRWSLPGRGTILVALFVVIALMITLNNANRMWHLELTIPSIDLIRAGHPPTFPGAPFGPRPVHFGYHAPLPFLAWLLPPQTVVLHQFAVAIFPTLNILLLLGAFWRVSRSLTHTGLAAFAVAWGDFPFRTGFLFAGLETFAMDGRVSYLTATYFAMHAVFVLLKEFNSRNAIVA